MTLFALSKISTLSGALAAALLRANAGPAAAAAAAEPLALAPVPTAEPTKAQRRAAAAARYAAEKARRSLGPRTAPAPSAPAAAKARRSAPAPRRASLLVHDFHDLAGMAQRLREEQERAEALAKAQREAAAKRQAERQLFSRSIGPITPLRSPPPLCLHLPSTCRRYGCWSCPVFSSTACAILSLPWLRCSTCLKTIWTGMATCIPTLPPKPTFTARPV